MAISRLKGGQVAGDVLIDYDQFLLVRDSATEALVQPYWELSTRYILMIRDLLAERQIPLVVGLCPHGILVGPSQWGA